MAVTELFDRYCQVWNEADAESRKALLASVWAPGATYTDPSVHAVDADALLMHIKGVREKRPGAKVLRTSEVDVHHRVAGFAWHVVLADGTALPEGIDIALLSPDGNTIERIIGFFGPLKRDSR